MNGAFTARAPGKLILCGEHAVVHGTPAIALAVNRFAECRVRMQDDPVLIIEAPAFCGRQVLDWKAAQVVRKGLQERYAEFLNGRRAVRTILEYSGQLLVFAVMSACVEAPSRGGLFVRVHTELPVGCGMGSSAAVASAVVQAVGTAMKKEFSKSELFELVMGCERLQHGNPSGVDAYASIYGGCVSYRRGGTIQPLPLQNLSLTLMHSGAPEASTGECVEQVRQHFANAKLRNEFEQVADAMREVLLEGGVARLIPLVRRNHRLLVEIGVVPERVQHFVQAVEEQGGAAKICGAGSIRGESAGMLWVLSEVPPDVWQTEFGYVPMQVHMVGSGTSCC